MSVMKRLLVSIGVTLAAAILFALIYPAVRGEAANSPNDALGYWLGTLGIPAVFLVSFYGSLYLARK
ncbi:MAG: hypothetical protein ACK47B_00035 [Armatimonadota bacterium]